MRLLLAALLACACPRDARAAVKNPDTYVFATVQDPDSLDPDWSTDAAAGRVISNVYERLLTFKPGGAQATDIEPMLATAVPARENGLRSQDGLSFRFPIRNGVRFHHGGTLTPEDVRYSILRFMLMDRTGGPSPILLEPLLGVGSTREAGKPIPDLYRKAAAAVTVDGDAVVVRLLKPYAPLLSVFASRVSILSKRWCAAHGQWDGEEATWTRHNDPVQSAVIPNTLADGTGPFLLERNDPKSQQIVLKRFEGYWRGPARLARVVIKTVPELSTRKLMLEAGDADSVYVLPTHRSQMQGIAGTTLIDDLPVFSFSPFFFFTIALNAAASPYAGSGKLDGDGIPGDFFADKDARLAFAYAMDYDAFVNGVQGGHGRQAAGFIATGMIGHRRGEPRFRLDLKEAAERLRRAHAGRVWREGFKMTIPYIAGRDDFKGIGQILKTNIESLNPKFRIDVRPIQASTLNPQARAHLVPLMADGWGPDFPDPDVLARPLMRSGGFYPAATGWRSAEADALVEAAAAALDAPARERLYEKLQRLVDDEAPFVPLYEGTRFRAQRAWVKGYLFRPGLSDSPQNSYYYDLEKRE
ncbi:MAG: ABC transporter substrate-binding protein [Elusimicrobia bacterium]|nr:ABC transporter substrate-binding protein [Elusimicrobiota bacterium]